jgi:hypothetical protein
MPSEGLIRALESLRYDKEVTANDIRNILADIRKGQRIVKTKLKSTVPPRVKVLESKCNMYRRKIGKLENLWVSAERRAQSALFHLETIREIATTVEKDSHIDATNLTRLLQVIETETDALPLKCPSVKDSRHVSYPNVNPRLKDIERELDELLPTLRLQQLSST